MSYHYEGGGEEITLHSEGVSYNQAFQDAAVGLFALMYDIDKVRGEKSVHVVIDAENIEKLYVAFLKELLKQRDIHNLVLSEFSIATIQKINDMQYLLTGSAYGETYDVSRHHMRKKIVDIRDVNARCERVNKKYTCQSIIVTPS